MPPRHPRLLDKLPDLQLKLLIGKYAQDYYRTRALLAATVRQFEQYLPETLLPLPLAAQYPLVSNHPWFESEVLPALQSRVSAILGQPQPDPARFS